MSLTVNNAHPRPVTFLTLPPELRLEIYQHCSALALLQLIATSRTVRHDLICKPAIIKSSFGYSAASVRFNNPSILTVFHISRVSRSTPEINLFNTRYGYEPFKYPNSAPLGWTNRDPCPVKARRLLCRGCLQVKDKKHFKSSQNYYPGRYLHACCRDQRTDCKNMRWWC